MSFNASTSQFEGAEHSKKYLLFRPSTPDSLVNAILQYMGNGVNRQLAVDVGCGSGQNTFPFSTHFEKVIGYDVSQAQIGNAQQKARESGENLEFRLGSAGDLKLEDDSVSLVTTCQAIHWFDIPKFYEEAKRVLATNGVIAVLGYDFTTPAPDVKNHEELAQHLADFYSSHHSYWADRRALVDDRYLTIPQLPFQDLKRDESHYIDVEGTLSDLRGYIDTWSGMQNMRKTVGNEKMEHVLTRFEKRFKQIMGVPTDTPSESVPLTLRTRYFMNLGRKEN